MTRDQLLDYHNRILGMTAVFVPGITYAAMEHGATYHLNLGGFSGRVFCLIDSQGVASLISETGERNIAEVYADDSVEVAA